jgi:hypothetical protein
VGAPLQRPTRTANLIPIGGLEKLLRHRLGDASLLYQALRIATAHS